jgi:catechol 2,3-dioxygenase-like lactoylglutathione lyase family enzyme
MAVTSISAQLRTADFETSIRFYTETLGFELAFRYQDFYAGIRAGAHLFHLKRVDTRDPSIDEIARGGHVHLYVEVDDIDARAARFAARGVTFQEPVSDKPWGMREFVLHDDQGHVIHFGQPLAS